MIFMPLATFVNTVTSETALRELIGTPQDLAVRKQLTALDQHCLSFIALSPLVMISTTDASGNQDVSPRGDAPGFVLVLDEKTLVIPERPGNRRLDSLRNIIQTSTIGLLFLVPGVEETLRINGRACLVRDAAILERTSAHGKSPLIAIGIEINECFLHCGKALRRSKLWDHTHASTQRMIPSLAKMVHDQVQPPDITVEVLESHLQEDYTQNLY